VETIFNYHLSSYVVILTIGFLSILKDKKLIALTIISSITLLSYFELFTHQEIKNEEFRIKILHTDIKQDDKWRSDKLNEIINYNLDLIDSAKDVDLIVLPESTFPLFLNEEPILIDILKEKSQDRAILLGSLRSDDKHNLYNSTYLFYDGEMITADKVVLVPFGEVIPLPKFISKFINELFFNGAEDYKVADDASNFDIDNFSFRPLICFEGTIERFYKDAPDNIILISNNAWFTPSIEPTLQKIILKYYAKKYNKRIFHSING
jgi:apolipoprotein N-acyltransferase